MSSEPIANYALLSDCSSAALVSASGSVDWLCFPRFDSPSVFGRLLGQEPGFWSIRPAGACSSTRRYLGPTMVLETTHTTPEGSVTVTDALVLGDGRRGHDLGADSPGTLLRQVSCSHGTVDVDIVLSARPDYGLSRPLLDAVDGGIVISAGAMVLSVSTAVPFRLGPDTALARVTLRAGDVLGFALHSRAGAGGVPVLWSQPDITRRLGDTLQGWSSWSGMHQNYRGPWQELVAGSGRLLQALTYYPTGAIVAAPTTSLPEVAGGTRNWDYRYTWIRDASMTLQALWVSACPDEAGKFFQFLATAAARQLAGGEELQIMFGVGGERELPERNLAHLPAGAPAPRSGWATAHGTSASSTCTVSCLTPPPRCRSTSRSSHRTPGCFWPTPPMPPPPGGALPTTASGRCAGSHATIYTPSSCAGWPSTGPSASPTSSGHPVRSSAGPRRAGRSRPPSAPRAGVLPPTPTPRPTAPTTSTLRP